MRRNRLRRQNYTAFTAVVWPLGFSPIHAGEDGARRNVWVDMNHTASESVTPHGRTRAGEMFDDLGQEDRKMKPV